MNGIKLLALAALVSMEAGAEEQATGTQPFGVPIYTLHKPSGSNVRNCRQAWINPAAVEVWRARKASESGITFGASCPVQATAEGYVIEFHALHGADGRTTHGGGFLYPASALDFRADLRNLRWGRRTGRI